ncbi:hypothetical protein JWG42_05195 [Desulfoprunum benzoelyticum]|uniref:Uncharacterized protein n=1 Tax=Desulfoprunum benzoelyticum TaxID=1506996 RepID=A0A840V3D9_9BACT|nr:hypothetical protein [Desulfoprunum benzoelyticum]MBB5348259.1 hypothetical protein [Desulfoprunum benzoelyticum]MBM9529548.1 hypothetical protein [Desulfoprunum benzoelyticum]
MKEFANGSRTPPSYDRNAIPSDAIQKNPDLFKSRDGRFVWYRGQKFPCVGRVSTQKADWRLDILRRRQRLNELMME